MPHINRIRVNNVKYNFGTQFYDDFLMRFSCKNTIYDLANGGGKSVLMLLLLQNLIPNCTLDDKQPIEKLFRTNEGSTTIHSMIEWSLSDVHIKDNFKYMLTGFCARKAKEQGENEENADVVKNGTAIEYFNYCIFYRSFNDNDIKNLPLTTNGERITYTGLKNYLKELQKNDYSLEVKIFERKGDYQRFITEYGLYESEWEIIRGINKTEGHVRTYFETNYKTTRKVVEDLLIEEIIEKSFRNKYTDNENDGNLAETLLNIKDKLMELSKKKEEINNFDRQIEIIDGFSVRISSIRQLYSGIENAFIKLKKVYNSLENAEVKNKNDLEKAIEERKGIVNEKNQLACKVETASVIVDMKELDRLTSALSSENDKLAQVDEEIHTFMDRLNLLESGNSYIEYIQCKKEYDKLRLVMDNILKDNSTLLSNLRELAAAKKIADENRCTKLSEEALRELRIADKEDEKIRKLRDENKELDNRKAVLEYKIKVNNDKIQKLNNKISEKKNNTSLLLPSEANKQLKKMEEICIENESQLYEAEGRLKDSIENINVLKLNLQKENYNLDTLENRKKTIEENSNKLLNSSEKLTKLKQVYQEEDLVKLKEKIEKTYRSMVSALDEAGKNIKNKEKLIKSLEENKPVIESEELEKVLEYIRRYHSKDAVSGAEYIANMSEDVKIEFVKNNPIIPYSIIIKENYMQTIMDTRIIENVNNGYTIPLINGEKINQETELIHKDLVSFISCDGEEFSKTKINDSVGKIKNEIQDLNRSYIRKAESEQVVKEDYLFIHYILDNQLDKTELEPEKALEDINKEILKCIENIDNIKANISQAEKNNDNINLEIDSLEKGKFEAEKEIEILSEIEILVKDYSDTEAEQKAINLENEQLSRELSDGKKRYEAAVNQNKQRKLKIQSMEAEQEEINREWNEKYASYFDEAIYQSLIKDVNQQKKISGDDLDTRLLAVIESLKKDNFAVSDKEKLLNSYQTSMQRSLQHIDYLGVDMSILENMYNNNELGNTTKRELSEIKQQSNEFRDKKKKIREYINGIRSSSDKLQGKINHAISIITEKYGEFHENSIKSEEVHTFLNENGKILSDLEEKDQNLTLLIKNMENTEINLSILKRDTVKLMNKSEINTDISAGIFEEGVNIEKMCLEVSEQLDGFIDEKYKRSEEFEKELSQLVETLKKLNAHELASEIRMNVTMPSDLEETEELIDTLKETNDYIELEKGRIIKGLEDMEIIKENFENQCIQSCINIKTELDRLSKLSRITMEDETISIINLRIPYVKDETYKERMSEYIDRIAKGTDEYDKTEDKLKFIRNNLSWKKMFSVIVTDMNAIRLNLYKRERIADQSRYLPYEEAVGSTGQSQGIYIQFLVSIINYISSINSRNADASRLKKVIFIDNPFGAAKDVYIWEPIFKLLKTNNVQLIVPARGATPAITGRFDVNYVLGQKMTNGRQQTVVVDYFSNVNNDDMDYTTLSYEQTALF